MSNQVLDNIEKLKLTNIYNEWIKEEKIIGATFEVTPCCNFNCVHCYMSELKENNKQLSFEEIIQILDILYEKGVLFITFSGGDPFVRKDFKDIYIYAKKKGFLIDIFSNGTLIDEEWISIFNEYPPLLIDLSIYGVSNETYEKVTGKKDAFDRFIHTLELLQKANIRFAIKAPLLSINYHEIKSMREISRKYSKENFRFSYEIVPDRNNSVTPRKYEIDPLIAVLLEIEEGSNAETLIQIGRDKKRKMGKGLEPIYFCSIGNLSVHIDYLGNVSPCIECEDKHNIFINDFEKVCKRFNDYKTLRATNEYKCLKCEAKIFCSSCPQVRKRLYGDEQIITAYDCLVAKLKYKYYVENFSIEKLKSYYLNYNKGGEE